MREDRFRQAAWIYCAYGVIYWVGGLVLAAAGLGPRGMERGGVAWFFVGALLVVTVPALLYRERAWFARWLLSRRDFARILTALVALRAVEVARIARAPKAETLALFGATIPVRPGAWAFFIVTLVAVVALARAAWARDA